MLKILFWILLIANIAVFGLHRGFSSSSSGREPERLAAQINADKIRLLPAGAPALPDRQRTAPAEPAAPATPATPATPAAPATAAAPPVAAVAQPAPPVNACVEIGNFTAAEAERFQTQLAPLQLADKLTRLTLRDIGSYIVIIAPQGSREAADSRVADLQGLGITDYFVFKDPSPLQWAISLGVFRDENAARAHLAAMDAKGVRPLRIAARRTGAARFAFQLRGLDPEAQSRIDAVRQAFPKQQQRACEAPQSDPVLIALKTN